MIVSHKVGGVKFRKSISYENGCAHADLMPA